MEIAIAVLGIFILLGKLFDLLTQKSEKSFVRDKLKRYITLLQETSFPNIHTVAISKFLSFFTVQGTKNKLRFFGLAFLYSWFLTSVLYATGRFTENSTYLQELGVWHDALPYAPVYLANFLFDFITIFVTYRILKVVEQKKRYWAALYIPVDVFVAYFLFVTCLLSMMYFNSRNVLFTSPFSEKYESIYSFINKNEEFFLFEDESLPSMSFSNTIYNTISKEGFTKNSSIQHVGDQTIGDIRILKDIELYNPEIVYDVLFNKKQRHDKPVDVIVRDGDKSQVVSLFFARGYETPYILASLSSFVPTILFLLFIVFSYFSKEVFMLSRKFSIRFLNSTVGEDGDLGRFSPGTHIGLVLGLIIALLKLIQIVIIP